MDRFLVASVLVGGASLVHLLLLRRVTNSFLSGVGSFSMFLLATTILRLGSVVVVLLASLVGGGSAALAMITGWLCVRTGIFTFALAKRML